MLELLLMVVGFGLVIKGADFLVEGASALARRLKVSDLVIGLTVIAFGTSLPELFVNVTASIEGQSGITFGNIVGSNIANILLILGVSAVIFPLAVGRGTVWKEIPLGLLAAVLVLVLSNDGLIDAGAWSGLGRIDGLVLLGFFIVFIYYTFGISRREEAFEEQSATKKYNTSGIIIRLIIGFVILIAGSRWVVNGAIFIADALGVSKSLIGLTIVAVGTSLPELATSAVAAYKKNAEIAVGNVVGSNIFNIFFVLGISSLIRPVEFKAEYNVDTGFLVIASLILFVWMFTGKKHKLDRWEAVVFLIMYFGYIAFKVVLQTKGI
ncbi:MAG: calcium/sodium antiporter [Phycisphaerae bacterium]|jgi:cation:H+ antiporter